MSALRYRTGDATDPKPLANEPMVIMHVCNDQGAWGAGFSGALSRKWPEVERIYRSRPSYILGQISDLVEVSLGTIWVCNLVAQHGFQEYNWKAGAGPRWRHPYVRYWAIRKGLRALSVQILGALPWGPEPNQWASVHCPRLGCGLAGGLWEEIEPILQEELVDRGIKVVVYDL